MMLDSPRTRVLDELARRYELSRAGRTGEAVRDLFVDYEELLAASGCRDGESRAIAEQELSSAARAGILVRIVHKRDPDLIQQLRFSAAQEGLLFDRLGRPGPRARRRDLASRFAAAAHSVVPPQWTELWVTFCSELASAAECGEPIAPFSKDEFASNDELLELIPKLLSWHGESLIRFASCVLCGDSKRLESLSGRLGQVLARLTQGKIASLEDLGIIRNPRFALISGPVKLKLAGEWLDLSHLRGSFRLSEVDICDAEAICTPASRCVTIENETTFHELGKLGSGELFIQTSYPGAATLALIRKLPDSIELWHFGDSDPEGFEILRDLRERSDRSIQSLHMRIRSSPSSARLSTEQRNRLQRLVSLSTMAPEREQLIQMLTEDRVGIFEQEALGRPNLAIWPFFLE